MRWLDGITNSMDMSLSKLGESEGQQSLVLCSPWGHKRSDMIERTTVISTVLYWHKRVDKPMKQNRGVRDRPWCLRELNTGANGHHKSAEKEQFKR